MDYFAAGGTTADETMSYSYDAYDRRSSVVDSTSSSSRETDYGYDADGRLTQITSPEGTIHYGYDNEGRHTRTWTDSSDIRYGYDALSRLVSVSEVERNGVVLSTPASTTYHYGADGTLQSQTLASGVTTVYTYDSLYRVLTEVEKDASGNLLASYSYTRFADGNIATVTEQVRQSDGTLASDTEAYSYDALDRLVEEKYTNTATGQSETTDYTLDLVGNRLAKQTTHADGSIDRTTSSYNERDELTSETTTHNGTLVETTTFGYDANGSLTTQTSSTSDSTLYTYDVKGLLAGATIRRTAGGVLVVEQTRYAYDPDGIRVREETATTTGSGIPSTAMKLLVVDGSNPTGYAQVVEERTATGALVASFVHGLMPISQYRDGVTSDYLMDGHSGVRQVVDAATAAVLAAYRYDAFGGVEAQSGNIVNPLLYRGERFDAVLGQYYLRARMYDPASGRFQGMDSATATYRDPLQLMRYGYAGNNSVMNSDPSGMFECSIGSIGAFLGVSGTLTAIGFGAGSIYGSLTGTEAGFWEGFIPGWGSGRNYGANASQGNVWAYLYLGIGITEIVGLGYLAKFVPPSLKSWFASKLAQLGGTNAVTGTGKLAGKLLANARGRVRDWIILSGNEARVAQCIRMLENAFNQAGGHINVHPHSSPTLPGSSGEYDVVQNVIHIFDNGRCGWDCYRGK